MKKTSKLSFTIHALLALALVAQPAPLAFAGEPKPADLLPNDAPDSVRNLPGMDGTLPGSEVQASTPAPKNDAYSRLSARDKCEVITRDLNSQADDPICGGNPQCNACVQQGAVSSTVGRYCQSYKAIEKAKGPQTRALALYTAGAIVCTIGCIPTPYTKALELACVGMSVGTLANELLGMKKVSQVDEEFSNWAIKADRTAGKMFATAAAAGSLGMLNGIATSVGKQVAQVAGKELSKEATKKLGSGACIAAPFMILGATLKGASLARYGKSIDQILASVEKQNAPFQQTVNQCRSSSGLATIRNNPLTYQRPKPVDKKESDEEQAAALGNGLVEEIFQQNEKGIREGLAKLPQSLQDKINAGEDPLSILRSENLIPESTAKELEGFMDRYKSEKTAFLNSPHDAGTMVANVEKKDYGNGVSEISFDTASVVHGDGEQGMGIEASDFNSVGSAAGNGGTPFASLGEGPFHDGFQGTIFDIVSAKLSASTKRKDVSALEPVLPLNRMRAGLKVHSDRKPASAKP